MDTRQAERNHERAVRWNLVYAMLKVAVQQRALREQLPADEARFSRARLGRELAEMLERSEPWHESVMHRVGQGERELDGDMALGMSRLCARYGLRVDPAWLLFGGESAVAAPEQLPTAADLASPRMALVGAGAAFGQGDPLSAPPPRRSHRWLHSGRH